MNRGGTLVVGASGLVGSYLLRHHRAKNRRATGTCHQRPSRGLMCLDITRARQVHDLVGRLEPQTIVLTAALTDVDRCEREPELGYAVNVRGTRNVAEAALTVGARLVHLSTDYVFDGKGGPYAESDDTDPVCLYGRQKLEAEGVVLDLLGDRALIVRTTGVFGCESPARNFVARLIAANLKGEVVRVPTDQIGTPTFAGNLAAAIFDLSSKAAKGVFHVGGRTRLNRYAFALLAAEVFGLRQELMMAVTTKRLGQDAPRPLDAGLSVEKAEAFLGYRMATAREGLEAMRREGGFNA